MPEPYASFHSSYVKNFLAGKGGRIIGHAAGRFVAALHRDGSTFPVHLVISEGGAGGAAGKKGKASAAAAGGAPRLFTATLADNLRYGDPGAPMERVEEAARQARLEGDIRGFPEGYSTLVGERGITLSGGQRQRAALGRALLVEAPLLVLDDALASVDNATAAAILRTVRDQGERSVLMISHQLSAAAACDRILVLENGRLVQQGHHSELVRQEGAYRRLWEREEAQRLQTA
jgi:ABC-type transport system involved in cytochrome bd biosynthesis fused ATPase/permease subunit